MKLKYRHWIACVGVLTFLAWGGGHVLAGPPGLPFWLWGAVTLDGAPAAEGTPLEVLVRGTKVATTTTLTADGVPGSYSVAVPADDPDRAGIQGGVTGDPVTFAVTGYELGQLASWTRGKVLEIPVDNGPFTYTFTAEIGGAADVIFPARDGGPGLIVNANGLDLGATAVRIRANQPCTKVPDDSVHRCFEITPANAAGRNATLTFYFYSSQIPDGLTCEDLDGYRWDEGGDAWQLLTTEARDCTGDPHALRVTGVTDFSDFVLASGHPNAVTLQRFDSHRAGTDAVTYLLLLGCASLTLGILLRRITSTKQRGNVRTFNGFPKDLP